MQPNLSTMTGERAALKRVAAIDLGTNSFHAVVADLYADGHFEVVDTLKEMVLLGEGAGARGLHPEAMDRGIAALRIFRSLCDGHGVERILAYATSAIREARNGGEFIQRAIDETGIKVNAISGLLEAELISHGVRHGIDLGDSEHLMVDIGGGSVEFIVGDREVTRHMESLKIGVARLRAGFVDADPAPKKSLKAMARHIREKIAPVVEVWRDSPEPRSRTMVGSSGTFQAVAMLIARRRDRDVPIALNGYEVTRKELDALLAEVMPMDRAHRAALTGLDERRIDLIVPGLVLIRTLCEQFDCDKIRISTQALREGILIRYMRKMMRRGIREELAEQGPRRKSIMELAAKCNWHETHSRHVCALALQLFDHVADRLDLGAVDRELLEYAAILHDIGYHISHRSHHKHALYIILNSDLRGFDSHEIAVIAHVARYHRRSTPKSRHEEFASLDRPTQRRIEKLAAILRVADGLDRSHYQNVAGMHVEMTDRELTIRIRPLSDPELEIWGAERKSSLLEKVLGRRVSVTAEAVHSPKLPAGPGNTTGDWNPSADTALTPK